MSVHQFHIRSLHFYLQQVQQHGSSRMGLGWQSPHQKDTSIIQVKISFTFLWDVEDSSKTKIQMADQWHCQTIETWVNPNLQWWSLHNGPRKQTAALTSKSQSSVYAGLDLNFRWNNSFLHTFLWQGTDGKASVRNRTALLAFFGQVGKYFGIWTHHGHHSNLWWCSMLF